MESAFCAFWLRVYQAVFGSLYSCAYVLDKKGLPRCSHESLDTLGIHSVARLIPLLSISGQVCSPCLSIRNERS